MSAKKKDWLFSAILIFVIVALGGWIALGRPSSVDGLLDAAPPWLFALAGREPKPAEPISPSNPKTPDGEKEENPDAAPAEDDANDSTKEAPEPIPTPAPTPTNILVASAKNPSPNLDVVNIFEPLMTPTPTPTPTPARTPVPPSLKRALSNWQLQYPLNRRTVWVFLDKRTRQNVEVTIGSQVELTDGSRPFKANVISTGKYSFEFEYEGQREAYDYLKLGQ